MADSLVPSPMRCKRTLGERRRAQRRPTVVFRAKRLLHDCYTTHVTPTRRHGTDIAFSHWHLQPNPNLRRLPLLASPVFAMHASVHSPAGTWSPGGNMEDCMPCGFGLTSADGSMSQKQCTAVSQPCPPGQWAAPDAVSAEQCRCYRGYGGALQELQCWLHRL
jgi:hypothetical protein